MRRDSTTYRTNANRLGFALMVVVCALAGPLAGDPSAGSGADRGLNDPAVRKVLVGRASWYGPGFHGKRTASGERFNRDAPTLASRSLPFGTRVRITNLQNGRQAMGRVNDRGPFHGGRIVDLSQGLARQLGMGGVGHVRVEVLHGNAAHK